MVDYYPPHIGGGEMFVSRVAEGLARLGHHCVVVTMRTTLEAPKIEEHGTLRIVRIGNPSIALRSVFTLLAIPFLLINARDSDVIHGASYGGAIPAFLASILLRKKSIYMVYEFMGPLWKRLESNRLKSIFYRLVEKLVTFLPFDKFVAISMYTRNCLRLFGIRDSKLEVVYGGQNLDMLPSAQGTDAVREGLGFTADDFLFLAYGRAGITKGLEYFVDAIPLIIKEVPRARFILILTKSDPAIWSHILRTLRTLPKDVFKLLPALPYDQLVAHLAATDCIVVPSLSEGFGLAVLEACTLGKKVVATDVGSIPEVVFGHHILVRPGSSRALSEGCVSAYKGEMKYVPPKSFRWEDTVRQFERIYEQVRIPSV